MTKQELAAIEARVHATAPGPWTVRYSETWHRPDSPACRQHCQGGPPELTKVEVLDAAGRENRKRYPNPSGVLHGVVDRDDIEDVTGPDGVVFGIGQGYDEYGYVGAREAEFAAAARSDVPALLAEVRRLQAEVECYRVLGGPTLREQVRCTMPYVHEDWVEQ